MDVERERERGERERVSMEPMLFAGLDDDDDDDDD